MKDQRKHQIQPLAMLRQLLAGGLSVHGHPELSDARDPARGVEWRKKLKSRKASPFLAFQHFSFLAFCPGHAFTSVLTQ